MLPTGDRLVTLIVTADLATVRQECPDVFVRPGQVLYGCNSWREVALESGVVRAVKIVRYVDAPTSRAAVQIAANQTCRTLAALIAAEARCETAEELSR
jgi:hypothetical protein